MVKECSHDVDRVRVIKMYVPMTNRLDGAKRSQ